MKHSKMKPALYRFDRDDELRTPPPFVRCPDCYDGHFPYPATEDGDVGWGKCPTCDNSPLIGYIPQYYTPEQYRDWIRRENSLPNYELPASTPVWVRTKGSDGFVWALSRYEVATKIDLVLNMVIATIAGRPPEDWRPE